MQLPTPISIKPRKLQKGSLTLKCPMIHYNALQPDALQPITHYNALQPDLKSKIYSHLENCIPYQFGDRFHTHTLIRFGLCRRKQGPRQTSPR